MLNTQPRLGHEAALALLDAVRAQARSLGIAVSVCVADSAGTVKAALSMDGAPYVSRELARRKALTALLGLDTTALGDALGGNSLMKESFLALPDITLLGGGVPVTVDGRTVGALGVGGGTPEQDAQCARDALAAVRANFDPDASVDV